jgi:hypothetical protein
MRGSIAPYNHQLISTLLIRRLECNRSRRTELIKLVHNFAGTPIGKMLR